MKPHLPRAGIAALALGVLTAVSGTGSVAHADGPQPVSIAPSTEEPTEPTADITPQPLMLGNTEVQGVLTEAQTAALVPVAQADQPVVPRKRVALADQALALPDAGDGRKLATGVNPTDATTGDVSAMGPAGVPLGDTFTLASRPESTHTLFLDPRGVVYTGNNWPKKTYPAYTYGDTDPAFDADDLEQLQIAWEWTAEDYAPFDINVTFVAPTNLTDLGRADVDDTTFGTQMVITSGGCGLVGTTCGGIATEGGALMATQAPAFAFTGGSTTGAGAAGRNIGGVVAHEAGHTFGLYHEHGSSEYYNGSAKWAPLMGGGYVVPAVTQWAHGEYPGARPNIYDPVQKKKVQQDEMAVLSGVLGWASSDNAPSAEGTVGEGSAAEGFITSAADTDTFITTAVAGTTITVEPTALAPNLDLALTLVDQTDASSAPVAEGKTSNLVVQPTSSGRYDVASGLAAAFTVPDSLDGHVLAVTVEGAGDGGNPLTTTGSYSNYGSTGGYRLSVDDATDADVSSPDGSFVLGDVSPLTRTPGVPMAFDVAYAQGDVPASGTLWAWSSSNTACVFSNPAAVSPTLTCPATLKGVITVTTTVRPSGAAAQTKKTSFMLRSAAQPAPSLGLTVAGQSSGTIKVCVGNAAAILGTVEDRYGRPIYGVSARIWAGGKATAVKSNLLGQVIAKTGTTAATLYSLDTVASGIYASQTTKIDRTVTPVRAPCFTAADTAVALAGDVTAIPGVATPLTATVLSDGVPVTGVPVVFGVGYETATGAAASQTLGSALTDATGTATYRLKAAPGLPSGTLKATVAKSAIVAAALTAPSTHLTVLGSPTLAFDVASFNINGSTAFTQDGFHDDELITNVTTNIAGRVEGTYGSDDDLVTTAPAGVPVTAAISYTTTAGKTVTKLLTANTDAQGWFRIPVKNPIPVNTTGSVTLRTTKTTYYPAVGATTLVDDSGAPAAIQIKPAGLSITYGTLYHDAHGPSTVFTVVMVNPWPNGSVRSGMTVPARVSFTMRSSGAGIYYTYSVARSGSFYLPQVTGTWTLAPVASTAYTPVPTTITLS